MVRRRVVVHGRVQGVYFRASCADQAMALGITGWVHNQPDGSVLAEFEGNEGAVNSMIEWCQSGPPRAAVTSVEVTQIDPVGDSSFRTD